MKPYKAKSLKGAEAEVRRCRKKIGECYTLLSRWAHERTMLAKLSADSPQFFNPLHAMEASQIRDAILRTIKP